ncbi:MAG: NADH-quinone oxidoreductase subunit NuoK [Proteobacteria bacterium]|nr:NADH-quinone oxidoreductase subunit NuoK [Pseudomonadota bacterium]
MNHVLFGNIGTIDYLLLAVVLFTIGVCGLIINRKNIITVLMSIELMLLAVNLNLVAFSVALQDYAGQIFAIFVLTVAAAEAAIGLAILVVYSRNKGNIDIENVNIMKG